MANGMTARKTRAAMPTKGHVDFCFVARTLSSSKNNDVTRLTASIGAFHARS
jgi:hypothetical protein